MKIKSDDVWSIITKILENIIKMVAVTAADDKNDDSNHDYITLNDDDKDVLTASSYAKNK